MEYVREVRISVYIDTNKRTERVDFTSLKGFRDWVADSGGEIGLEVSDLAFAEQPE